MLSLASNGNPPYMEVITKSANSVHTGRGWITPSDSEFTADEPPDVVAVDLSSQSVPSSPLVSWSRTFDDNLLEGITMAPFPALKTGVSNAVHNLKRN